MRLTSREDTMQVDIRARQIEIDESLRAYIERRLRFALGRFGERIGMVTARFENANGARGGVDKQCRINVGLRPSGNVIVEDVDADLRTVVDRTSERVGRAVSRDLKRRRAP